MHALEPRVLLDAAAAATAAQATHEAAQTVDAGSADAPTELLAALAQAPAAAPPAASAAETQPATAPDAAPPVQVYFIDAAVSDAAALVQAIGPDAEIHLLAGDRDGVEQMAEILQGRSGIDAVHVISHGSEGNLQLGATQLNTATMTLLYEQQLRSMGQALSADGDLLLYGCDFAHGESGSQAMQLLATLTQADVTASTDDTGAQTLGGNWTLESSTGVIETTAFAATGWNNLLTAPSPTFDLVTTPEDTAVDFDIAANDTDPDGDTVRVYSINNVVITPGTAQTIRVTNGTILTQASGNVMTFVPDADYTGNFFVPNQVIDSRGEMAPFQNLTIVVTSVKDIVADDVNTNEDTSVTFNPITGAGEVSGADNFESPSAVVNGVNNQNLAVGATRSVTNGTVTRNANGTLTFTPNANFNGLASFTYRVLSAGTTETELIRIQVAAVNDPPVNTVPGAQSVNEGATLAFSGANAISVSDVDNDVNRVQLGVANGALTVSLSGGATISAGANGTSTLTLSGTQTQINAALATLTYQSNSGFGGSDSLSVNTSDSGSPTLSDSDSVAITVVALPRPPVIDLNGADAGSGYAGQYDRAAAPIGSGITVTDVNGDNITSMTVTLANATASDTLALSTSVAGITSSYNASTGVLTLSGNATLASYQSALAAVRFASASGATAARTISVQATSAAGAAVSNIAVATITPVDTDGDGVANAGDLDDDNDGIVDNNDSFQVFSYAGTYSSISNNEFRGTAGGVPFALTSAQVIRTNTGTGSQANIPAAYQVPNNNPTASLTSAGTYTLTFAGPIADPILVLTSIGNASTLQTMTLSVPYEVIWSNGNITFDSPTQISGREGHVILRLLGGGTTFTITNAVLEGVNLVIGAGGPETDTDGDGVVNRLDLDSDNDGITDNVEAQTTQGYIAPSGQGAAMTDADRDGLDDRYDANTASAGLTASRGLTAVDTDGDGIRDYIDSDSDGDGKADIVERGDGQATSVTSTTDTDGDGLLDIFEAGSVSDGYDVNDSNFSGTAFNLADLDNDTAPNPTAATPRTVDFDYRDNVTPPLIDLNSAASFADTDRANTVAVRGADPGVLVAAATSGVNDSGESDIVTLRITLGGLLDGASEQLSIGGVSHGTVNVAANGSMSFTPTADFNGTVNFSYVVQDPGGLSATGTVAITVTPVADAADDVVITDEDTPVTFDPISGAGVVSGADSFANPARHITAIDGTAITAGSTVAVASGTVLLNDDGTLTFTPAANFNGTTSFTYTVSSGGVTETATVDVSVNSVDDNVTLGGLADGSVAGTDGSLFESALTAGTDPGSTPLTLSGTFSLGPSASLASVTIGSSGPITEAQLADSGTTPITIAGAYGNLQIIGYDSTSGVVSYRYTLSGPVDHSSGDQQDNFNIGTTDTDGDVSAIAGVLALAIIDDAPIARNDIDDVINFAGNPCSIASGNVVTGSGGTDPDSADGVADLLGADGGAASGPVTGVVAGTGTPVPGNVGISLAGSYGTLVLNADGSYVYTPDYTNPAVATLAASNFILTDTFTYQITDGDGDVSTAVLSIAIAGQNDAPTVSQIQVDVDGDGDIETIVMPPGGITQNLTDPEGKPVGSLTVGPDGTYSFVPAPGYTGPVPPILFTVEHDDGSLSTGLISMNVQSLDIPDPLPGLPVLPPLLSLAQPPQDGDVDIIDSLNDGRGNASGTNDTQAVTGVLLNMLSELSGRASTSLTGPGVVLQAIEGTASLHSIDVVRLGDESLGLLSDAFAETRYATNPLAVRPHEITSSNRVDGLWLQLQSDRLQTSIDIIDDSGSPRITRIRATTADGRSLPNWIRLDAARRTVVIDQPADAQRITLRLEVTRADGRSDVYLVDVDFDAPELRLRAAGEGAAQGQGQLQLREASIAQSAPMPFGYQLAMASRSNQAFDMELMNALGHAEPMR